MRPERDLPVVGVIAHQVAVIEFRRFHDLAGIEEPFRIEPRFHLAEGAVEPLAEHRLMELRAHDAVAVLAGVRPLVIAHHGERLFGDGAHRLAVLVELEVQDRAHMQAADGGVRIPGAARAVLLEDGGQACRIIGQMFERHRAILDERDGLPLVLHGHHDVEAGLAHLGERRLLRRLVDFDDTAPFALRLVPPEAEIAHHLAEPLQPQRILGVVFRELHEKQRFRRAAHGLLDHRAEHRDVAAEANHRLVHEFDRDGLQRDEMLGRVHRFVEGAEMANAERTPPQHGPEPDLDGLEEGERAFRPDEDVREVVAALGGHQRVKIIAAHAPLHLGKARGDLVRFARAERQQVREQLPFRCVARLRLTGGDGPEADIRAVRENGVDRKHIVARRAEAQRAPAAGIVRSHAADGGAARRGDIDREPKPVRLQAPVQIVEHDARLDDGATVFHIELRDAVQMFRRVDDQPGIDGLAALGRAPAARRDRHALFARDAERRNRPFHGARNRDSSGQDLVHGRIGRIAPAVESAGQNIAIAFPFQAALQHRHCCYHSWNSLINGRNLRYD